MSKIVEYRGCTIQSTPRRVGGSEKWGLYIILSVDDIRNVRTREFSSHAVYATEQEAEIHGIAYGQRIIDGKVEGQAVIDLNTSHRRAIAPSEHRAWAGDVSGPATGQRHSHRC